MIVSSIRLRNSGRNAVLRTFWISRRIRASSPVPASSAMIWLPRFEVMMMTVLRKSTVRPWPSVSRPSSRTWSSTLKTSRWAFSISSSRTTE